MNRNTDEKRELEIKIERHEQIESTAYVVLAQIKTK